MEKALLSLSWTIWYGMKTNLNKIQIKEHLKFFEGFSRELFAKSSLEWSLGQSPGLLRCELNGEELIDKLVKIVVVRLGEDALDGLIVGKKIAEDGRKVFQEIRTGGIFGEAHDGLCAVEEDLDVTHGGRFQEIDGKLEDGDIVLVFCHFADGGSGEAFAVFREIEIGCRAVDGKWDRDRFIGTGKEGFDLLAAQTEGDLFDACRKIGVNERERKGKDRGVFSFDFKGLVKERKGHRACCMRGARGAIRFHSADNASRNIFPSM